jgi:preprotein translocase subunit SecG
VLATAFVALSIILAALAVRTSTNREIDSSLQRTAPVVPADPLAVPAAPAAVPAVGPAQGQSAAPMMAPVAGPAKSAPAKGVPGKGAGAPDPLAGAAKQ